MRDTHDIRTDSTSPPHKKIKPVAEDLGNRNEMMDTEEVANLEDLSFKLEDMEIDAFEEEDKLEEISQKMDAKVVEKNRKAEEKERLLKNKLEEIEKNKIQATEVKAEKAKILKKKQKQKQKSLNKKERKKRKGNLSITSIEQGYEIPNLRNVPRNQCEEKVTCTPALQVGKIIWDTQF